MENKKHNLIYLIVNLKNGKIYVGCHSTNEINDNYMGSGKLIKLAIKKYGRDKFRKIILYDFDNRKDMLKKENELIDIEFISGENVYNMIPGGGGGQCGLVTVRDAMGKTFSVAIDDSRYINGELKFISTGFVTVKDKDGKTKQTSINDPDYIDGSVKSIHFGKSVGVDIDGKIQYVDSKEFKNKKLTGVIKGTICVKDKNNRNIRIKTDEYKSKSEEYIHPFLNRVVVREGDTNLILHKSDVRFTSGELSGVTKGTIPVRDTEGNCIRVKKDDPRLISGQLKHINIGLKMSDESKIKMSNAHKETVWIHDSLKKNKRVKDSDLNIWLNRGWILGRIIDKDKINITDSGRKGMGNSSRGKKWINKDDKSIRIYVREINKYVQNGWKLGRC